MWRKIQALVGSFCLILYAAVVIWAGFSIIKAGNVQKTLAEREFGELTSFANSVGVHDFFSQNFSNDIERFFRTSKTMQALIITGPSDENITLEKIDGAIRSVGGYPRFSENIFFFQNSYVTPLRIEGLRNAGLSVLASRIDYESLINILRTALFAVILTSAVAFGTLMIGFAGAFRQREARDNGIRGIRGARREKPHSSTSSAAATAAGKQRDEQGGPKVEVWEKTAGGPTEVFLVKKVGERPAGDAEDDALDDFAKEEDSGGMDLEESLLDDDALDNDAGTESAAEEAATDGDAGRASAAEESAADGNAGRASAAEEAAADDGAGRASAAEEAATDGDAGRASAAEEAATDGDGDGNLDIDDVLFGETDTGDVPEALSEEDFIEEDSLDDEFTDDLPDFEEISGEITEITEPVDTGGDTEYEVAEEDFAPENGEDEAAPDMPVYEEFGDQVDEDIDEHGNEHNGLLAAAARVYEQDSYKDDESEEFMNALSDMLTSADENNEDICLVDAEWIEAENNAGILIDAARDFFKEDTKVFERGPSGVHIIIPDATLDEGFSQVKEFYGKAARENAEDDLLVIGLSAKSGRKIDPHLLVKETRTAIEKGTEDDTLPIVAFKVDLEKYNRLYAAQQI